MRPREPKRCNWDCSKSRQSGTRLFDPKTGKVGYDSENLDGLERVCTFVYCVDNDVVKAHGMDAPPCVHRTPCSPERVAHVEWDAICLKETPTLPLF